MRATGLGFAIAMGRIGVIMMPWICMYLSGRDLFSPWILFSIMAGTGVILNLFMPSDRNSKFIED